MKLFLDTNFIMEFVEQRKQFDKVSIILDSVFSRKNEAYISTGCMYTLAFLFEQNLKRQDIHRPELTIQLRSYLAEVLNMAKMVELSHAGAERAVYSEAFTDIEDSFQYQCAVENRCEVLLTINIDDFREADQRHLEILTPTQFVEKYMN